MPRYFESLFKLEICKCKRFFAHSFRSCVWQVPAISSYSGFHLPSLSTSDPFAVVNPTQHSLHPHHSEPFPFAQLLKSNLMFIGAWNISCNSKIYSPSPTERPHFGIFCRFICCFGFFLFFSLGRVIFSCVCFVKIVLIVIDFEKKILFILYLHLISLKQQIFTLSNKEIVLWLYVLKYLLFFIFIVL